MINNKINKIMLESNVSCSEDGSMENSKLITAGIEIMVYFLNLTKSHGRQQYKIEHTHSICRQEKMV